MELGLREANQNFSKAIRAVKAGQEVILTERGKPIAVIKPLPAGRGVDAVLDRLAAEGRVRRAAKRGPMRARTPVRVKAPLLTQAISEERDER